MPPKRSLSPARPETLLLTRLRSSNSLANFGRAEQPSASPSARGTELIHRQAPTTDTASWGFRSAAPGASCDMDIDEQVSIPHQAMRREPKRQAPYSPRTTSRPTKPSITPSSLSQSRGAGPSPSSADLSITATATIEQSSGRFKKKAMVNIDAPRARPLNLRHTGRDKGTPHTTVTKIRGYESADELNENKDVTRTGTRPRTGKVDMDDLAYQMMVMKLQSRRRKR